MSVTIRPYINGGWEADIRVVLPDARSSVSRKKAPASSKSAAERWTAARERVLATARKTEAGHHAGGAGENHPERIRAAFPRAVRESEQAKAERERCEAHDLAGESGAGVRRPAVECGVIDRLPCSIRLLRTPKGAASFDDFDECERLVESARAESQTCLAVLLGGEAGLRCGEIVAPKGGRLRYVPLTKRLTDALRDSRHLRSARVLCDAEGKPLTQKMVQLKLRRAARRANVKEASTSFGTRSVRTSRRVEHPCDPFRSSPGIRTSARRSATCT